MKLNPAKCTLRRAARPTPRATSSLGPRNRANSREDHKAIEKMELPQGLKDVPSGQERKEASGMSNGSALASLSQRARTPTAGSPSGLWSSGPHHHLRATHGHQVADPRGLLRRPGRDAHCRSCPTPRTGAALPDPGQDAKRALGAGIVVTSPKGDRLYVLQIHFAASNNVAEYEALIHGLKLAKEIGVRRILCFGDSDLVIQQASGDWDAKDANMASYRLHVQQLSGFFDGLDRGQADQEAGWPHTVTFLKEIIVRCYPHSIITDNGSNFAEGIFKRYCGEMGIRMDLSSVAHPETNGQVEKVKWLILSQILAIWPVER
ncbi:hypothetical protein QYE76_019023 [Lolium multiflorum]|uniref:Integrase catalytic domain-containing protein n=1 Tax=Lolium multiflorum TaxID=4521 RepID=A0AAD8VCX4_LOLMU|nr:hypothetical protein QYE76_019023 [Lolium multiflorum]